MTDYIYVNLTKLKTLEAKYEKAINDNESLVKIIDNLISSHNELQKCYKTSCSMFDLMNEAIKNLNFKNEDDLPKSTAETLKTGYTNGLVITNGNETTNLLIKIIDKIEFHYSELKANFEILLLKCKYLKTENSLLETELNQKKVECMKYSKALDKAKEEVQYYKEIQARFKEIDKCIVDSLNHSFVLYTNQNKAQNFQNDNDKIVDEYNIPYIHVEPIPSFIKFLTKKSIK